MKKLIIVAVLSLLILSSCTREPENIEADFITPSGEIFRLATNEAVNFKFHYPENFILDKNAAMINIFITDHEFVESELETEAILSVPVNPNLSATVFTLEGSEYDDAGQYWNEYIKPSLDEVFRDVTVESSEDIEIAGISGRKYVYTGSLGGQEYKFAQVIFFKDREVYKLLYTATPSKFDRHSRVLDVVIDTFDFK